MSKFKVGDAVIPARGDVHDLFGHWMEYWAKGDDVRPTKFYVVGFSEDGEYVIYNASRSAIDGPHIRERDLQLAPYTSCDAAEVDNLADEYGGAKAKFKKGDKIRVIKLGGDPRGSNHLAKIGDEFTVDSIHTWGDDIEIHTEKWYFYPHEIEHVAVAPATATATGSALRIEAGKFYKTRDGRKVGPMATWHDTTEHKWEEKGGSNRFNGGGDIWREDGTSEYSPHLIAEWTDEPVARAFPVNSRVVRANGYKPDVYGTVTGHISDEYNTVKWDDNVGNSNTWQDYELKLAAPTTIADIVARHSQSGTAIVAVLENGHPRPATRPYVHGSTHLAETEANRLARTNPGKEFGVYTLGAVAKVERVYEHEWQRLALAGKHSEAVDALAKYAGIKRDAADWAVTLAAA